MKLDKYKQRIIDSYRETNQNIFIEASAGTGKTTVLLQLLKNTPLYKKCIFLAFNKSIAEEIDRKCEGRAEVKTLHGKAFSILLGNKRCRFQLNKWRDYSICSQYCHFDENLSEKAKNSQIWNIAKLYNLMRINLIDISQKDKLARLSLRWDVEFNDYYYGLLSDFIQGIAIEQGKGWKDGKLPIDFTDQLYLTYVSVPEQLYPKYDVVFIDEAQDLNPLQREVALRLLKDNGRLVTVGDFSQQIYGFQGSSIDSFSQLRERPNTVELPLNITYRCAKRIVTEALKYSDKIEAKEDADEGVVRFGTLAEVNGGDYVLCRNNYPLIEAFMYFLEHGKKSVILGKDYGENLLNLLEQVGSLNDLTQILHDKAEELRQKGVKNVQANESFIILQEKVEIISLLVKRTGSIERARQLITEIFSEGKGSDYITLSTIHKSKGLEADRVFIIGFHELIPSKYALTEFALYGERCLQFVAVTRAKNELVFIPYKEKEK